MKNIVIYCGLLVVLVATGLYLWQSKTLAVDSAVVHGESVSRIPLRTNLGE